MLLEIDEIAEEELGPGLSMYELNGRLEHSRIAGDYYRDLSENYKQYETSGFWPVHPFPNETYANYDSISNIL